MKEIIQQELSRAALVLSEFSANKDNIKAIEHAAEIMINCIKSGGKIIACGNGGSMSDAMHFCSELTGRYRNTRPAIPAIAISDPGHLSCVANDIEYAAVFSRFIEAHGKEGDVLLALSTSGKSHNVINAAYTAGNKKMKLVFITGSQPRGHIGTELVNKPTYVIQSDFGYGEFSKIEIPHSGTADRTQEVTILVIHILVKLIEEGLGYE